jgi:transcription initiation factor TFIIB
VSESVRTRAREIVERTAKEGLHSGKSPTGFAAAAIYTASLDCDEKQTQRAVADVAQVTEVTIRNRYQEQTAVLESDA